jgi:hypothetical protein
LRLATQVFSPKVSIWFWAAREFLFARASGNGHVAGLNRRYTSRILRMAALSPPLVDAIMAGKHSPLLTLVSVTDDLPLEWNRQQL